jgi:mRNA-degrading endonuclease RelE of RelBE toxin-antitoxin system
MKLDKSAQITIRDNVENKLSAFPDCASVKKLTDHKYSYRLRIGNYRVFFEFDGEIRIIEIEEVKKRDEHTY